jgi:ABC-type Mn2+/Zn2+ transport system ATPase subunit
MLIHLEKLGKTFGEKVVLHDVTASVEREDRIGIVGQNGAGKTTLLKILTGEYQDYEGEFSVTHGVTLGYLEQNAKLDATLDIYGEMRATFAPVLDAMAQMQILERRMAAQPDNADLLAQHDALQNIVDAADGYNMDVNIKKVLSGMGFAQDTWQKNIAVLSGGELTRLRLAKLLLEKPDVLILDEPTNHLDFATMEWLENYLKGYSGAVLVVSHDRYFLDNVCTKIWEVSFQTMTTYKGTRWILLRNGNDIFDTKYKTRLDNVLNLNEPLMIAYYLKEDLREIWNQTNKDDAELVLNEWVRQAMDSKIQPLVKMAATLRAYKPYILAWYDYPISNGPTEGINNKIKVLKRQMYGFRNDEFFTLKLYALHDKRLRI